MDRLARALAVFVAVFGLAAWASPVAGEDLVAQADLLIQGMRLVVSPVRQAVDPGRPTVVYTSAGAGGGAQLPPSSRVEGDLTGPGLTEPLHLTTVPGEPFMIPGLSREGLYQLAGIRLTSGGQVLLAAEPSTVEIEVKQVLVASVTSRPLTPEEMRRYGIVISDESYQTYRYTVGFQTMSGIVEYGFNLVRDPGGKILLPRENPVEFRLPSSGSGFAAGPEPQVGAFSFDFPTGAPQRGIDPEEQVTLRSMPGFLIIPTDMTFLHQFFSVLLVVQNGALDGSGLVLRDLQASLQLPEHGLRQASTTPPTVPGASVPVLNPGPDGRFGTGDDLTFIVAQARGQAEWLVEVHV